MTSYFSNIGGAAGTASAGETWSETTLSSSETHDAAGGDGVWRVVSGTSTLTGDGLGETDYSACGAIPGGTWAVTETDQAALHRRLTTTLTAGLAIDDPSAAGTPGYRRLAE